MAKFNYMNVDRTYGKGDGMRIMLLYWISAVLLLLGTVWSAPTYSQETIVYRVNAGGPALAGTPGWEADKPQSAYVNTGKTFSTSASIDMTHASIPSGTPEAVLQTERWDHSDAPEMQWDFPVTPGTYEVRLYFAEIWDGAFSVGARQFDVLIEGALVLDDYDVFAEVGSNKGVMKSFVVTADSNLDIDFLHVVQNPAIKGIEIVEAAPGQLGVSPTSVDFGSVDTGSNGFQSIELTNLGTVGDPDIIVQSTTITGTDATEFSDDFAGPVTLAPGESMIVGITFTPLTTGDKTATLEIDHDGTNSPVTVPLAGTGTSSSAGELGTSTSSMDFGSVIVGDNSTQSLQLTNLGDSGDPDIVIQSSSITGTDATEFSDNLAGSVTLSPGESTTIDVTFSPGSTGAKTATLEISHDGTNSPTTVSLAGSGVSGGGEIVYRVNAGGPALAGSPGWEADDPQSTYVNTGKTFSTSASIDMTHASIPSGTPEALFQTERWDHSDAPEMQWDFPVTAGTYEVRLYFAEIWDGAFSVGARQFDVLIEGALVLDDYDVFAEVGGNKGVMKSFVVTADSNLDIDFVHVVQNPAIKGIEIVQGTSAQLGVSPTSVDFGSVDTGSNGFQSIELTNLGTAGDPDIIVQSTTMSGTDAAEFSDDFAGPVTLAPGNSITFVVTFSPTTIGDKMATLEIDHDGTNSPVTVPLAGTGTDSSPGEVGTSTSSMDFGSVTVGSNSTQSLQLTNLGGSGDPDIVIQSTSITGTDATEFSDNFAGSVTLGPGESTTIDVTFSPASTGAKTATLEISHDGINSPITVSLAGSGVSSTSGELSAFPSSVDFGSVATGSLSMQSIELSNLGTTGDLDIIVQSTTMSGTDAAEFSDDFAGPVTLGPGESVTFVVTFAPTTIGDKTATLQIDHDGTNAPTTVSLAGTGTSSGGGAGELGTSTSSMDFGSVTVGSDSTQSLQLTNLGSSGDPDIVIQSTSITGTDATEFSDNLPGSVTLSPGESTTIDVTFSPGSTGAKSATLEISHDGTNSPTTVSLAGSGVSGGGDIVYRVNAGGPALAGSPGWEADDPQSAYVNTGNTFATSASIDMTHASIPSGAPEALFQTERWDHSEAPEMQWDFPVTPGTYQVRLYFAEIWSGAFFAGARQFDVLIEGGLVLNNYDAFSEVGSDRGVVKTFVVEADSNLDIDFLHVVQNPAIKAIEIVQGAPGQLGPTDTGLDFGTQLTGSSAAQTVKLTNLGVSGDPSIQVQSTSITGTNSSEFLDNFADPVTLAPGQSTTIDVTFVPTSEGDKSAVLEVFHNGTNSPLLVRLSGTASDTPPISFSKLTLVGTGTLTNPTSLQFGPDGRLYVSEQNGIIHAYDVVQNGPGDYSVSATETINVIASMPNHDDDGTLNGSVTGRLVTGILVTGTASNPVIYVNSSDPRIGAGPSGEDLNLDTNSGILSRLTWNGASWDKLDLVRGLPRSEENHAPNGLYFDEVNNLIYFPTGGNTNTGARSNNFALLPEYALSTAILQVDLNAIGEATYDLPTLDDEDSDDANDPFGGNNGKNQAVLVPGGPVQVYAAGFRNAYDIVFTEAGQLYTIDNGPNGGWGDVPINEGPQGNCTNDINEPGVTYPDSLHHVTEPGYYGGHPNPTRGNMANVFNSSDPQSPVSSANPVECDHLAPGVDSPALTTFPASTNGITEYTASNFGGSLAGDLLTASFDNKIYRILLDDNGAFESKEALFSSVGDIPLDITAQGDSDVFPGTIWVADIVANEIVIFAPEAITGCSGADDPSLDEDSDGYDNADEIDNGTNPCSSGDVPPDNDGDFTSDINDPDDDNDGLADTVDPFAIDPNNGTTTNLPVLYTWENDAPDPGGLLNLGFTGLMSNGTTDYLSLFDPAGMTAGGAAGVVTIDEVSAGNAGNTGGDPDTQEHGFQFGINVDSSSPAFTARTRIATPFAGVTPADFQSLGLFIGKGDQDNYLKVVLNANGGSGGVQVAQEVGGGFSVLAQDTQALPGPDYVDLYIEVEPGTLLAQASYQVTSGGVTGTRTDIGSPVTIPADWLDGATKLAVGIISTSHGATPFPGSWDFIEVVPEASSGAEALFKIDTTGINGSTFASGSLQITNQSQSGQRINRVTINLSNALFPDMVFDPDGLAGDTTAKGFTPDSGANTVGLGAHAFLSPHDDGFDVLQIDFSDFDVGELFTFSVDVDPTSIKGAAAPGPNESGSVSGLELTGSTVTIQFDDGSQHQGPLFAVAGSDSDSQNIVKETPLPALAIDIVGISQTPATVTDANQTVHVTGPAGSPVVVLVVEGGLFTDGVPDGGFDLDPFEANSAVAVTEITATIGAGGSVDVPVTLTKSDPDAGLNYIVAGTRDGTGHTSAISNTVILELSP